MNFRQNQPSRKTAIPYMPCLASQSRPYRHSRPVQPRVRVFLPGRRSRSQSPRPTAAAGPGLIPRSIPVVLSSPRPKLAPPPTRTRLPHASPSVAGAVPCEIRRLRAATSVPAPIPVAPSSSGKVRQFPLSLFSWRAMLNVFMKCT